MDYRSYFSLELVSRLLRERSGFKTRVLKVGANQEAVNYLLGNTSIDCIDCLDLDSEQEGVVVGDVSTYKPKKKYDVLLMHEVLEHVIDDVGALKHIRENILASDGLLFLSVPHLSGDTRYHIHLYDRVILERKLLVAGFYVTNYRRRAGLFFFLARYGVSRFNALFRLFFSFDLLFPFFVDGHHVVAIPTNPVDWRKVQVAEFCKKGIV